MLVGHFLIYLLHGLLLIPAHDDTVSIDVIQAVIFVVVVLFILC